MLLVGFICNLYEITYFWVKLLSYIEFCNLKHPKINTLEVRDFERRIWLKMVGIIWKKMKRQKATSHYFCSMLNSSRVMSFWKFIYYCHTLHIVSQKMQPFFTFYNLWSNYNLEVQKVVNSTIQNHMVVKSTTFQFSRFKLVGITTCHITTRQYGL